ncbi:MAG: SprB repeat-containing protein [Bacteroidetes bacterium]|nr:SprB repeat-containing protein [Bacteroidota bacterium]
MKHIYQLKLIALLFILFSCQIEEIDPPVDCSSSGLNLTLGTVTDSSCGQMNGQIEVSASGGTAPYTYSINGLSPVANGIFTDLGASQHTILVSDADLCEFSIVATVNITEGLEIIEIETHEAGCGTATGSIGITVDSGKSPYQFSLDGGTMQGAGSFSGITSGDHELVVVDADGCEINQEVYVPSGVSFNDQISEIITNKCTITGCHNGTVGLPDFRVFTNIKSNASQIQIRTTSRNMPQTGELTDDQIDLIACWVEDGALEN